VFDRLHFSQSTAKNDLEIVSTASTGIPYQTWIIHCHQNLITHSAQKYLIFQFSSYDETAKSQTLDYRVFPALNA